MLTCGIWCWGEAVRGEDTFRGGIFGDDKVIGCDTGRNLESDMVLIYAAMQWKEVVSEQALRVNQTRSMGKNVDKYLSTFLKIEIECNLIYNRASAIIFSG